MNKEFFWTVRISLTVGFVMGLFAAILAMSLTGCGLMDQIEEVVDPPPKVIEQDTQFMPVDTVKADTLKPI